MHTLLVYFLGILFTITGYHNDVDSIPKTDSLQFKTIVFSRSARDCEKCNIEMKFSYPQITGAGNSGIRDSLNNRIRRYVLRSVYRGIKVSDPRQIYGHLVQEYDSLIKIFPDYPHHKWYLNRTVKIIAHTSTYISLEMEEDVFTGGAHPLSTRNYETFNENTGQKLSLHGIIKTGMMDTLLSISERIFRETRSLSPDTSLKKAGFWFKNGQFHLNNNFAITSKEVIFYFIPCEIAPYAWGPTLLKIPRNKLKDIVTAPFNAN